MQWQKGTVICCIFTHGKHVRIQHSHTQQWKWMSYNGQQYKWILEYYFEWKNLVMYKLFFDKLKKQNWTKIKQWTVLLRVTQVIKLWRVKAKGCEHTIQFKGGSWSSKSRSAETAVTASGRSVRRPPAAVATSSLKLDKTKNLVSESHMPSFKCQ